MYVADFLRALLPSDDICRGNVGYRRLIIQRPESNKSGHPFTTAEMLLLRRVIIARSTTVGIALKKEHSNYHLKMRRADKVRMYVGVKAKARVNTTVSCHLPLSANQNTSLPAARHACSRIKVMGVCL